MVHSEGSLQPHFQQAAGRQTVLPVQHQTVDRQIFSTGIGEDRIQVQMRVNSGVAFITRA